MASNQPLTKSEINQLIACHGGPAGARNFLTSFVRKSDSMEIFTSLFLKSSSKTLNKSTLLERLQLKSFIRGELITKAIMSKGFSQGREDLDLNLVLITPKDLGLEDGGFLKDIKYRAQRRNLGPCPMETAPYLLLSHQKDWVSGISVIVYSQHFAVDGQMVLFDVASNRLRIVLGVTETHFEPNQKFLFRKL